MTYFPAAMSKFELWWNGGNVILDFWDMFGKTSVSERQKTITGKSPITKMTNGNTHSLYNDQTDCTKYYYIILPEWSYKKDYCGGSIPNNSSLSSLLKENHHCVNVIPPHTWKLKKMKATKFGLIRSYNGTVHFLSKTILQPCTVCYHTYQVSITSSVPNQHLTTDCRGLHK